MKAPRGFSLIELMMVVAIIAILTAIAISFYGNATAKSQLSEAFVSTDGLKTDVVAYYAEVGSCPTNGNNGFMAPASYSGKYVLSSTITNPAGLCVITVQLRSNTISPLLQGKQVTLTMSNPTASDVQWSCSSNISLVYLPQACR